ncbi:MAG: exosome complex exonuclease Rrp41 [Candidatus Altiarchaeota archaeon]|nr:exosome complex exonuclease Rrp41 [Candidatus Altiarchaeota archaeon]
MSGKSDIKLIENGVRLDGRKPDELRPIKMEIGILKNAQGSAYVEWGKNKAIAGVYGPRVMHPKRLSNPTESTVRVTYNMAPFSVEDRKRPGPDRRSVEISKISSEALSKVIETHLYPDTSIDVFIEILQADAGTRCVGLTAASLALADAGVPMRDLVVACAAGKAGGEVILDLFKDEDNFGEADLPMAIAPRTGEVVLLQMDGQMTNEEFEKGFDLAYNGCLKVYEMMKQALLAKEVQQ